MEKQDKFYTASSLGAPMNNKIDFSNSPDLAQAALQNEAKAQERGIIGRVFGSKDHAPTNIAGIVLIVLLFLLAASMFFEMSIDKSLVVPGLVSAVTFGLGIIFGRSAG
ncbi:hypothetical protein [Marinicauda salina]|uniref:hypothetical protein n=1 Tax=Marinicauda salina TaxID=2135793 RepID=UPI0011B234F8|nr:hypothetical protein [Marinicauda salina]